jgi:hypothetical protein
MEFSFFKFCSRTYMCFCAASYDVHVVLSVLSADIPRKGYISVYYLLCFVFSH